MIKHLSIFFGITMAASSMLTSCDKSKKSGDDSAKTSSDEQGEQPNDSGTVMVEGAGDVQLFAVLATETGGDVWRYDLASGVKEKVLSGVSADAQLMRVKGQVHLFQPTDQSVGVKVLGDSGTFEDASGYDWVTKAGDPVTAVELADGFTLWSLPTEGALVLTDAAGAQVQKIVTDDSHNLDLGDVGGKLRIVDFHALVEGANRFVLALQQGLDAELTLRDVQQVFVFKLEAGQLVPVDQDISTDRVQGIGIGVNAGNRFLSDRSGNLFVSGRCSFAIQKEALCSAGIEAVDFEDRSAMPIVSFDNDKFGYRNAVFFDSKGDTFLEIVEERTFVGSSYEVKGTRLLKIGEDKEEKVVHTAAGSEWPGASVYHDGLRLLFFADLNAEGKPGFSIFQGGKFSDAAFIPLAGKPLSLVFSGE